MKHNTSGKHVTISVTAIVLAVDDFVYVNCIKYLGAGVEMESWKQFGQHLQETLAFLKASGCEDLSLGAELPWITSDNIRMLWQTYCCWWEYSVSSDVACRLVAVPGVSSMTQWCGWHCSMHSIRSSFSLLHPWSLSSSSCVAVHSIKCTP